MPDLKQHPEKLVLGAIRKLGAEASRVRIEQETGLGRGAVFYWLGQLEDAKKITWERDWKGRRIAGGATITGRKS